MSHLRIPVVTALTAVYLLLSLSVAARAQDAAPDLAPRIETVVTNAQSPLLPGDILTVEAEATPRGQATFELLGTALDVPMQEVSPGRYLGTYTIPKTLEPTRTSLVVHLTVEGRVAEKEYERPVVLAPQEAGRRTAPLFLTVTSPAAGQKLSDDFVVTGQTQEHARIRIEATIVHWLIPGIIRYGDRTVVVEGLADSHGDFAVPLRLGTTARTVDLKVQSSNNAGAVSRRVRLKISVTE